VSLEEEKWVMVDEEGPEVSAIWEGEEWWLLRPHHFTDLMMLP